MDGPLINLLGLLIAGGGFYIWWQDYRANRRDEVKMASSRLEADATSEATAIAPSEPSHRLPGAYPTTLAAVAVAVGVSLLLLGLETWTEIRLGVSEEQSDMTVLFGLYTLAAAFIEELIFRGFIYYDKGGKALLVLSCLAASILFAVIHPYMWHWNGDADWTGKLTFDFSTIAVISTSFVFIKSLWYYTVRFYPLNPRHSLIPCIAAHFATNVGVFAIKAMQGHVVGWY